MTPRLAVAAAASFPGLLGAALAQTGPMFEPTAAIKLRVDGLPELFAALPTTAVGRILADPGTAATFDQGLRRYRQLVRRRHALLVPLRPGQAELEPWQQQHLAEEEAWRFWHDVAWSDLRSVEIAFTAAEQPPRHVLSFACTPRAEGRLSARFERIAGELRQSGAYRPAADEKIAGVPGHVLLGPPPVGDGIDGEPASPAQLWFLHTPGQFALGGGPPAAGTLVVEPESRPPGISATFDVAALLRAAADRHGAIDPVAAALGLDRVARIEWTARIAGELLLDELAVVAASTPTGLIGSLLTGSAALPAQAMPEGALLQLRVAADPAGLASILTALDLPLPPLALERLLPQLTGGIALGIAAPPTGGVIPRLHATLGLRSAAAAGAALAELVPPALRGRPATYGGVSCTTLKLPDLPAGLQPAFAVHADRLWIAETPRSLRDLLAAQTDGIAAMDVGSAPLPPGDGEPLPSFDLRFDEAAIYRSFHDVWLPLYSLLAATQQGLRGLLGRDDLPTPDEVAPHLGCTRGVLRWRGDRLVMQHLGRLGGPVLCGYAITWGPMASASLVQPWQHELLRDMLAKKQLTAAWAALSKWHDQHGSFPPDLGALIKAGLLPPEQLLLPGDPAPDLLPLGDGRSVRSSYRYFPTPVVVPAAEGSGRMLLIGVEVASNFYYRRPMLADDGTQPHVFGDSANKPIDEFGR